jgi:hypothetical protein
MRMFALLLGLTAAPAALAQWVDVKGEGLRALYSDKTHRSTSPPFTAHYAASGIGVMSVAQGKFQRSWRLRGDDQVCFAQMDGSGWCVTVQKSLHYEGEYRSRRTTDGQLTTFRVDDGIPAR